MAVLVSLLSACGGDPNRTVESPPSPSASPMTATPAPVAAVASPLPIVTPAPTLTASHYFGGSIVIAGIGQPGRQLGTMPAVLRDALYDSLLGVDPANGALVPALAEKYEVSADARTFTFHLRAGVAWHDGQPLTADDVVWTIKTLSSSTARLVPAADFGPLTEAKALDPRTVVVTLANGYCPALTYIGTLKILPAHLLRDKDLSALSNEQMIGTGPLVLKGWTSQAITLDRNPKYWNGAAPIEHWAFNLYTTATAARAAVTSGQADLFFDEGASRIAAPSPGYRVTMVPANRYYSVALNRDGSLLADAQLRQVIALALDHRALAQNAAGDAATLLATSVLPTFWAAPPGLQVAPVDPARARELLGASGWRDANGDGILEKGGKPLRLTLWAIADDPLAETLALSVRAMLAQVGIQGLIELEDRDGLLIRVLLHEYDLAIVPWNIPLDPDQHWYWQSSENNKGQGLNVTSYSNPAADDLLGRGERAPGCSAGARQPVYADLSKLLAQDMPQIFLFAPPLTLTARNTVIGPAPSSFAGAYWNLNRWEITP